MAASDRAMKDRAWRRLTRTSTGAVTTRARLAAVDAIGRRRRSRSCRRVALASLAPVLAARLALHAEAALCPLADHRHHADDPAAVGRRLRLHGAPLADGDAAPVGGGDPRHRRDHRHDRDAIRQRRLLRRHPHRAGPAGAEGRHPAAGPAAAARPEAVLLDPRPDRSARRSPTRSTGRSGSTRSAIPTSSRSASSSTTRCCGSSPGAARPMPRTPTSSSSGWSAPRWCC